MGGQGDTTGHPLGTQRPSDCRLSSWDQAFQLLEHLLYESNVSLDSRLFQVL